MPSPERENTTAESNQEAAALFTGDVGELPLETRRVLVQLLAGPSIDARRHGSRAEREGDTAAHRGAAWQAAQRLEGPVTAR